MSVSTHSTVVVVKAQLVVKMAAALANASTDGTQVQVEYAWPGPATEPESVFLGRHPALEDIRTDATHEDPTIKAGRRSRQESYDIPITVWVFGPNLTPADAQKCELRAFELLGLIEDMLADDPLIGLTAQQIQHVLPVSVASTLRPFEAGWACDLVFTVAVSARLM